MVKAIKSTSGSAGTQTVERAANILRFLTAHNRTGLRLVDLYKKVNLERSTAHRILQALVAEELAAQHPKNKRYFLGPRIYEMGLAATPPVNLRDICHPYIKHVAKVTGDTVFLVTRAGFEGVCIDRAEGSYPIRVFVMDIGRRRPLNIGAANTAMLSTLSDYEIERICIANQAVIEQHYKKYTEEQLWKRIDHGRKHGYVANTILEVARAKAVAVPIRTNPNSSATLSISVSTIEERLSGDRLDEVSRLLMDTAKKIESEIGGLSILPPITEQEHND